MFQGVFRTGMQPINDPVNSLSELVMEEVLELEDDFHTDEHSEEQRRLKAAASLVWHIQLHGSFRLQIPGTLLSIKALRPQSFLPENPREVLLPPPDVQAITA